VVVHQDAEGRFSLNDFHRAAGGEARHQPSNFLRSEAATALVEELTRSSDSMNAPVASIRGGPGQGTYVCRELVYAYASWVSAAFHLKVLRVFDAYAQGRLVPAAVPAAPAFPVPTSFPEALRLAADMAERVEAQAKQLAAQAPAVEFVERYNTVTNTISLRDAAAHLRIPPKKLNDTLLSDGILFRRQGDRRMQPHAEYIQRGFFEFPLNPVATPTPEGEVLKDRPQTRVTPKGVLWLGSRYAHLSAPAPEHPAGQ
jgi:phage antirepressor YoqD-like protein